MKKPLSYWFTASLLLLLSSCASSNKQMTTISLEYHQFSELDRLMEESPRPIAVFLHTDWCKFCHNMEQTTFRNEAVIQLLNTQYYFISFDGEQKEEVLFRNHFFKYQPTGRNTGTHELALALGAIKGTLAYPTFVLLNTDYEIVFQHGAFMSGEEMKGLLEEGRKE